MDWLDLTIHYLGIGALTVIVLGAAVGVLLTAIMVVIKFTPRLNVGRPANDGELCFYDYRSITTGKDGERITAPRRMINAPLGIKWWFGRKLSRCPEMVCRNHPMGTEAGRLNAPKQQLRTRCSRNLPELKIDEGRDLDFSDLGISVQVLHGYQLGQIVLSAGYRCEVVEHNGALHLKRLWPATPLQSCEERATRNPPCQGGFFYMG